MNLQKKVSIVLASLLLVLAAFIAFTMIRQLNNLEDMEKFSYQKLIARHLNTAAKFQAVERGIGNSIIKGASGLMEKWTTLGVKGDEAVQKAIAASKEFMTAFPDEDFKKRYDIWQKTYSDLQNAREKFLNKKITSKEWLTTATKNIREGEFKLRDQMFIPKNKQEKLSFMISNIEPSLAWMAEFAGLERAIIGGTIGSGKSISESNLLRLKDFRARVEFSYAKVMELNLVEDLPTGLKTSMVELQKGFITEFNVLRNSVYQESKKSITLKKSPEYPVSSKEWIEQSTAAINHIFAVVSEVEKTLTTLNEARVNEARTTLFLLIFVLILFIAIATMIYLYTERRVMKPLANTEEISHNMKSKAQQMSEEISNLATAASELDEVILEISEGCQKTVNSTKETVHKVEQTEPDLKSLVDVANHINTSLENISSISKHTDLLALNASIEAASAGEAGKSFAVVANEVKELASRSNVSSQEIVKKVLDIQKSLQDNFKAMNSVLNANRNIEEATTSLSSAIEEFSITIKNINDSLSTMSNSSKGILSEIGDISDKMSGIMGRKSA